MDFSFKDQITLGIDTSVLVNWPKPGMASLPVSLSVSITEFSGTVRILFMLFILLFLTLFITLRYGLKLSLAPIRHHLIYAFH
jgi:hypothetical protein